MKESDFEAQLRADGYTEIEAQKLAPRPGKGRHRHHFAIRGLSQGRSSLRRRVSRSRIQQARYLRSTKENCTTNGLNLTARKSWSVANF
jgi:hypothetical protein